MPLYDYQDEIDATGEMRLLVRNWYREAVWKLAKRLTGLALFCILMLSGLAVYQSGWKPPQELMGWLSIALAWGRSILEHILYAITLVVGLVIGAANRLAELVAAWSR